MATNLNEWMAMQFTFVSYYFVSDDDDDDKWAHTATRESADCVATERLL